YKDNVSIKNKTLQLYNNLGNSINSGGAKIVCTINLCLLFSLGS
uniref:Uncharacterized protein n=1 Tax=Erpetoichthys calabaricus TaxID=27687 RepID=A0A8C4S4J5_ERPCA